ncbi:MAG TPA: hypothetical protein VGR35_05640 [Tepidisphaeraceae bacterium]|nr:hypothetical protein [Tepidisphaeraceae bacterium]
MARPTFAILAAVLAAALVGCAGPSKANIALRKQNAALRNEVASLKVARESDMAAIRSLERNATTVPVLPHERVSKLFTAHGLKLGRLTGGWDADVDKPGHEGLQIYVVPTDEQRDEIKAAGTFIIEAFDLSRGSETRLGRWEIPTEEASKQWLGNALQYGFIFELPWQSVPSGEEVTVRVTFIDELTGRRFTAQRPVKVVPPSPATNPVIAG